MLIFIMNRYISKSYTTSKNTIDQQHTERGQVYSIVSTITGINNNVLLELLSRDGSLPFKQLTPYNREKKHYCY